MRRKSFSLVLLIFIVIFVILFVIFAIKLINGSGSGKKSKNEDSNETQVSQTDDSSNVLDSSFFDSLEVIENGTSENTTNDTPTENITENNNIVEITESSSGTTGNELKLHNHTYKFDDSVEASRVSSASGVTELSINYTDKIFNIVYGTDNSQSFEDLKSSSDLKNLIESKYNVSVTSAIKQGNLSGLDLIICTVSEGNEKKSYFLFTPLNESEVAYAKIYNSSDDKTLINDLSDPLNSVSSIISSVE